MIHRGAKSTWASQMCWTQVDRVGAPSYDGSVVSGVDEAKG